MRVEVLHASAAIANADGIMSGGNSGGGEMIMAEPCDGPCGAECGCCGHVHVCEPEALYRVGQTMDKSIVAVIKALATGNVHEQPIILVTIGRDDGSKASGPYGQGVKSVVVVFRVEWFDVYPLSSPR